MKEQLWKDIRSIYEHFMKNPCENLNIISVDNYYTIAHHSRNGFGTKNVYIKIQKEYNLINMWNDGETIDRRYHTYTIECSIQYIADIDNRQQATIPIEEDRCIEEAYGLLKPYLRELKLTTLGI